MIKNLLLSISILIAAGSLYGQVANGLIQHFKFDNSYTNEAGNITFSPTAFTADRNGMPNSAILIGYTMQSQATIPGLPYGNSARTISFWAKANQYAEQDYDPVFTYGTGTNSNAFSGSFSRDRVMVDAHTDHVTYILGGGTQNTAGIWYHFVMTYDGTTVKIYRNGTALGTGLVKNWNTINNNDIFKLGLGVGGEQWFAGAIDDLKIYDRAVDDPEAELIYNGEIDICTDMLSHYNFDGNPNDHNGANAFTTSDPVHTIMYTGGGLRTFQAQSQPRVASIPNIPIGNASRTISFWMRTSTPFSVVQRYFYYGNDNLTQTFGLYNDNTGRLVFQGYGTENDVTTNTSIAQNNWTHIAVVHNSHMVRIYVHGVLRHSFVPTNALNTGNTTFKIGAFEGAVDNLTIYNRALSSGEINALYNTVSVSCTTPPVSETNTFPVVYTFDNKRENTEGLNPFSISSTYYTADRNGNVGKAIEIAANSSGSTSTINILPKGNAVRSFSVWYKALSHTTYPVVFSYGTTTHPFTLYSGLNGNPIFFQSGAAFKDFGGAYTNNQWHHAVITYDGTTMRMYMNGVLVGSQALALNTGNNSVLKIGNSPTTIAIDDLKIYNTVLTDADVANLYSNNSMPVTLLSFTAKAQDNSTLLNWQTASETDNKHFVIKRSTNGTHFTEIATVTPNGSNSNGASYIYTDNNPTNGINYYQLLQVDLDGKTTDLGIRTVTFNSPIFNIRLFPNPAADKVELTFSPGNFNNARLTDINGKTLQHIRIGSTQQNITVPLNKYPRGIYLLQLQGNGNTSVQKIVKQ